MEGHDLDEGLDLLGVLASHQKGLHALLRVTLKVRRLQTAHHLDTKEKEWEKSKPKRKTKRKNKGRRIFEQVNLSP